MLRSFGVMTIPNANRLALSVSAIAAMLTGCGGSQALAPPAKVFPDGASASRFIEPESMIAGRSPHKIRGETFSGQGSGIIRCGGGQYHFYESNLKTGERPKVRTQASLPQRAIGSLTVKCRTSFIFMNNSLSYPHPTDTRERSRRGE